MSTAKERAAAKLGAGKETSEKAAPGTKKTDDKPDPVVESKVEANGQGRLPGQPVKIVKSLVEFAKQREDVKAIHKKATADLKDLNSRGIILYGKNEEHFQESPDGKKMIYAAAGVEIVIKKSDLKLETHTLSEDDE